MKAILSTVMVNNAAVAASVPFPSEPTEPGLKGPSATEDEQQSSEKSPGDPVEHSQGDNVGGMVQQLAVEAASGAANAGVPAKGNTVAAGSPIGTQADEPPP